MFRELDAEEKKIIRTLKKRGKVRNSLSVDGLTVMYSICGNHTVASVQGDTDMRVGVSKYAPGDAKLGLPYNDNVGRHLAFTRAMKAKLVTV